MKKITTTLISLHQLTLSPLLMALSGASVCRFEETCSMYAKRMIEEKGVARGLFLGIVRLSKCQPFYAGNLRKEAV